MTRFLWIIGMLGSVAGALVSLNLPHPYDKYVTAVLTVCAAVTGYQVQHPPPSWDGVERRAPEPVGGATIPFPHSANRS